MSPLDRQAIHQADCVGGHVSQLIRRIDLLPSHHALQNSRQVDWRRSVKLGRQADIAIIEANNPEAMRGKIVAKGFRPSGHLRP